MLFLRRSHNQGSEPYEQAAATALYAAPIQNGRHLALGLCILGKMLVCCLDKAYVKDLTFPLTSSSDHLQASTRLLQVGAVAFSQAPIAALIALSSVRRSPVETNSEPQGN